MTNTVNAATPEDENEDPAISEAYFVMGEGDETRLVSAEDFLDSDGNLKVEEAIDSSALRQLEIITKSLGVAGSNQTEFTGTNSAERTVNPPYDPLLMTTLSQLDEVAYSCARAKAFDSTKRQFTLDRNWDPLIEEDESEQFKKAFAKEVKIAQGFLATCAGPYPDFQEVMYKSAMDVEIVGWGALEVIRSADGIVRSLAHVPASRVKPLKGWKGFEERGSNGKKVYYQPFGSKVVSSTRINPLDGSQELYDPDEDGELNVTSNPKLEFNLKHRSTGEPTSNFKESANELIWQVKTHPSTIYYGITDNLPAMGHILANYHISNYLLQYFEHNTVPRYVVLIKGGRLEDPVKRAIVNFFRNSVKGRAHSTLVVPIPGGVGGVDIEFKELDTGAKDGWFREVQKDKQHSIRLAHGVPAAVAGFSDSAEMGGGKGNSQLEMYRDRFVAPAQRGQSQIVTKIFRLGLGITRVRGRFEELDVRNQEALMRLLTAYHDRGILSSNDVKRIAKLGPPTKGGTRSYRIAGGSIVFTDELDTMKSTIVPDKNDPESQIETRGGDQRLTQEVKKEPLNNLETAAETGLKGEK